MKKTDLPHTTLGLSSICNGHRTTQLTFTSNKQIRDDVIQNQLYEKRKDKDQRTKPQMRPHNAKTVIVKLHITQQLMTLAFPICLCCVCCKLTHWKWFLGGGGEESKRWKVRKLRFNCVNCGKV